MTLCWKAQVRGPILASPLQVRVPGCKSITQRAALLAAVADGESRIGSPLLAGDSRATLGAVRALGVRVEERETGAGSSEWVVQGRPELAGPTPAASPLRLDFGNSGTGMRLAAGLLCGRGLDLSLEGDASLSRRPMRRIADPLAQMGAGIETSAEGTAPLRIRPAGGLRGIEYELPVASAQVKSAVLLAGLSASGETAVTESWPLRDHTERMLRAMGAEVRVEQLGGGRRRVALGAAESLAPLDMEVPGDPSAAIFTAVLAVLAGESPLYLNAVMDNPTRTGFVEVLRGAGLSWEDGDQGGCCEPTRRLSARRGAEVPEGFALEGAATAACIDEIPALAVFAACCSGTTRIRGAAELRVKESDRLRAIAQGLERLGIEVQEREDGLDIAGRGREERVFRGDVSLDSCGDHRIAMAFAVAAARCDGPIEIRDVAPVATSYPAFADHVRAMGLSLDEYEAA